MKIRIKRILIVDDDPMALKMLCRHLESAGHQCVCAASGEEALALLSPSIDLVLLDIMMPGMDGYSVCRVIRNSPHHAETPVIFITALSSVADRIKAVEAGANDFITKPIDKTEVLIRTSSLLQLKEYRDELARSKKELEETSRVRAEALTVAVDNLRDMQESARLAHLETIHCLSAAAEYRDKDTSQHILRMSRYCSLLARALGLPDQEVEIILHSSPMHDVGKIGIPDAILLKPKSLDDDEWKIMKEHSLIGHKILDGAMSELLIVGAQIALTHHERWDGAGYPRQLSGDQIPLYGRIAAVADVFDALTSARPYKEAFSNEKALDIIKAGRGTQFDPALVDLFLQHFDKVLEIQKLYAD